MAEKLKISSPLKNVCLGEFCSILNDLCPDYKPVFNHYHTYFSYHGEVNYCLYCVQKPKLTFLYFRIPRNKNLETLLSQTDIYFHWDDKNHKYRLTLNKKQLKRYHSQIKEWIRQTLESSNINLDQAS